MHKKNNDVGDVIGVYRGGISVDDRGKTSFVNDFDFKDVKRFYYIQNHKSPFIRAWHGHKRETKYITVVKGSAVIGVVKIDDWDTPTVMVNYEGVKKMVLSSENPTVVRVPPGCANGVMTLTDDTIVMVFSTSTLTDSLSDDFRFDARLWDIWNIEER